MRKWITVIGSIVLDVFLFFIGAFFLLGGIWNFLFGSRMGVMFAPLMILSGGLMLIIGIIVARKVFAFIKTTKKET